MTAGYFCASYGSTLEWAMANAALAAFMVGVLVGVCVVYCALSVMVYVAQRRK